MSQIGWVEPTTPVPPNPTTAVDNGDGTGTITNPDGTTVPFCAECPEINAHALDEDGNLVITSPDGTATTYIINQDTLLGPYTDADGDGIYTAEVLNPDGTPTGTTVDSDFNALISSPHPDPVEDTFMSATVNADGSITLQYMNADGPVGDPIVIPADNDCDAPICTTEELEEATDVYHLLCVDGQQKRYKEDPCADAANFELVDGFVGVDSEPFTGTLVAGSVVDGTVTDNSDGTLTLKAEECVGEFKYVNSDGCEVHVKWDWSGRPDQTFVIPASGADELQINAFLSYSPPNHHTKVDWGDGTVNTSLEHDYLTGPNAALYTGNVTIYYSGCQAIQNLQLSRSDYWNVTDAVVCQLPHLQVLSLYNSDAVIDGSLLDCLPKLENLSLFNTPNTTQAVVDYILCWFVNNGPTTGILNLLLTETPTATGAACQATLEAAPRNYAANAGGFQPIV